MQVYTYLLYKMAVVKKSHAQHEHSEQSDAAIKAKLTFRDTFRICKQSCAAPSMTFALLNVKVSGPYYR